MSRQPRFELVRTDAVQPWHARFRAANGRIVWTTESYKQRESAYKAIDSIIGWVINPEAGAIEVDER